MCTLVLTGRTPTVPGADIPRCPSVHSIMCWTLSWSVSKFGNGVPLSGWALFSYPLPLPDFLSNHQTTTLFTYFLQFIVPAPEEVERIPRNASRFLGCNSSITIMRLHIWFFSYMNFCQLWIYIILPYFNLSILSVLTVTQYSHVTVCDDVIELSMIMFYYMLECCNHDFLHTVEEVFFK